MKKISQSKNTFFIFPTGGLCNKLRVILSWLLKAKKENKKLTVYWQKDKACPGFFKSIFENPEPNILNVISSKIIDRKQLNYKGYSPLKKYPLNNALKEFQLNPLPHIKTEIKRIKEKLPTTYIALHIRRTDLVNITKKREIYTSNHHFFNFVDQFDKNLMIYLATDNPATQKLFLEKYKTRIVIYNNINNHKKFGSRFTPLQHAVIDLYLCIDSTFFCGTQGSSFSQMIKMIKDINIKNQNEIN
jgi:hypothetical protein